MRILPLRAVLMIALAILGVVAIVAIIGIQHPPVQMPTLTGDVAVDRVAVHDALETEIVRSAAYVLTISLIPCALLTAALILTRGLREPDGTVGSAHQGEPTENV